MLNEKDYCDYDTCVALKEVGYKVPTSAYYTPKGHFCFVSNPFRGGYVIDCFYSHNSFPKEIVTSNYIDAPTMWEAQKWLREQRLLLIEIDKILYGGYKFHVVDFTTCTEESCGYTDGYEEALLEGIKEAIRILKEEK